LQHRLNFRAAEVGCAYFLFADEVPTFFGHFLRIDERG
jgi:hypothetical protein